MQKFNRRQVIQLMGSGLASVYLAGCASVDTKQKIVRSLNDDWISQFGPVNRRLPDRPQVGFSGDNPSDAHRILWKKDDYFSSIP